jgi:hypothetical protein
MSHLQAELAEARVVMAAAPAAEAIIHAIDDENEVRIQPTRTCGVWASGRCWVGAAAKHPFEKLDGLISVKSL